MPRLWADPCENDAATEAERFVPLEARRPLPVRRVEHTVQTFSDMHYGDVGRGWWYWSACSCEWQSAVYRSGREADCAGSLHLGAMQVGGDR